jgi:hypothetical protein
MASMNFLAMTIAPRIDARIVVRQEGARQTGIIGMDKRSDDGGRLTPLERIKAEHQMRRAEILYNDTDELDWADDISPQQVGLRPVWADDNGKLWVILRDDKGELKLRRLWQIT